MERLTRTKRGPVTIYTKGKYEYTTDTEMETEDVRAVMIKLSAHEDTGLTPERIQELKEQNTAKDPEDIQDAFGDGMLVCPNCGNSMINYFNRSKPPQFCMICGQRLKWEE